MEPSNPYDVRLDSVKPIAHATPAWAWALVLTCLFVAGIPTLDLIRWLHWNWKSLVANPSSGLIRLWLEGIKFSMNALVFSMLPVVLTGFLCYRSCVRRVNMVLIPGTAVLIVIPFFLAFDSSLLIMWLAQ